jgi:hypothetical protein
MDNLSKKQLNEILKKESGRAYRRRQSRSPRARVIADRRLEKELYVEALQVPDAEPSQQTPFQEPPPQSRTKRLNTGRTKLQHQPSPTKTAATLEREHFTVSAAPRSNPPPITCPKSTGFYLQFLVRRVLSSVINFRLTDSDLRVPPATLLT